MRLLLSCLFLGITTLLGGSVLAQDASPSPTATEEPSITLSIWWPDSLALSGENSLHPLLLEQSEAFAENQVNLFMEHRIKAVGTTGGIMSTLRSASNVAPNALPSLTLLRRQDLLVAEREGLLQSLEGGIPSTIQGDLSGVLTLGQVNGELYGLPYLLDLQHLVYRPKSELNYTDWSYAAVLEREQAFVFAAGRTSGINDVFLLQYLASGGSLNPDGSLSLNPTILENNLEFYQAALELGIVDNLSLNHSNPGTYLADFQSGVYDMAVFNSSTYLQLYAEDSSLAIAPIPNEIGSQTSILNGWVWVLTTNDARERVAALDYIAWMMDSSRQASFAEASFNLPSRQTAMALGLAGDAPPDAFLLLLENPVLPLSDAEAGVLGSAMQTALGSVLNGESSAEEAAQTVINQVPQ
jgi:ABC-type glycerol-3-phosphate transport system substrate-binding protein